MMQDSLGSLWHQDYMDGGAIMWNDNEDEWFVDANNGNNGNNNYQNAFEEYPANYSQMPSSVGLETGYFYGYQQPQQVPQQFGGNALDFQVYQNEEMMHSTHEMQEQQQWDEVSLSSPEADDSCSGSDEDFDLVDDDADYNIGTVKKEQQAAPKRRKLNDDDTDYSDEESTTKKKTERKTNSSMAGTTTPPRNGKQHTSISVFEKHVTLDANGALDVSGILSRECYEEWLNTRKHLRQPHECFRKALISHISVSDGASMAFSPEVEAKILELVRKPRIWPCFAGQVDQENGKPITIGIKGLRTKGYHERKELGLYDKLQQIIVQRKARYKTKNPRRKISKVKLEISFTPVNNLPGLNNNAPVAN